jgi:hypothetical protein
MVMVLLLLVLIMRFGKKIDDGSFGVFAAYTQVLARSSL